MQSSESIPTPPSAEGAAADFAPDKSAGAERDPFLQDSVLAQQFYDRAMAEAQAGDEEYAVDHFLRASKLAETAREWYLAALALHQVGHIFRTPQPPYDLERALRMYRRAVVAYEECGHWTEARALAYEIPLLKMRNARELKLSYWTRAELGAYWAIAGFGYRPLRVVAAAFGCIVFFGLCYWLFNGVVAVDPKLEVGFPQAMYFSGITFSTVGYGDFVPAPHIRFLAMSEGMLGAFAMSFFVVVLANRMRH
ncbi:MAG: potassium channel family protein [Gemmataceae bacterium]|nr:potassium channel family protein [Gemmataceae bacterium]